MHEAATIVADGHGWRLPVVGGAPMHLSKLEQDTQRVRFFLRDRSVPCWSIAQKQFFVSWALEIPPGFIGALLIDPQVRLQHTLELGEFLINMGMGVRSDDTFYEPKITLVFELLSRLMAQASTPLNASWLAARVFPLVKEHMVGIPLEHMVGNPHEHMVWRACTSSRKAQESQHGPAAWLYRAVCASEPPRGFRMAKDRIKSRR